MLISGWNKHGRQIHVNLKYEHSVYTARICLFLQLLAHLTQSDNGHSYSYTVGQIIL